MTPTQQGNAWRTCGRAFAISKTRAEPNTPEAYAVVACRELEHQLSWTREQLLDAGAAYQGQAVRLVQDLEQRFAGLTLQQSVPEIAYWQGLDPAVDLQPPATSLHSLPLLRRLAARSRIARRDPKRAQRNRGQSPTSTDRRVLG